ncbi:MAG: glycosidase [Lentisphaerae bacterium]|nr:glycosidase [Lentisphaerota bacterium]
MKRCSKNPVVSPDRVKPSADGYRVRGAFNPGAIRFGDEILLLLRVAEDCPATGGEIAVPTVDIEDGRGTPSLLRVRQDDPDVQRKDTRGIVYRGRDYLSTLSHIRIARSRDGVHFKVDDEPFIFPSTPAEMYGVEDARVVRIDGTYTINYTCVSSDSWATALATTTDFRTVTRHGLIFHPENKDVAIFPERIGGKYGALHRPNNSGFGKPSIWYAESPDLRHWGNHRCLLRPRDMVWEETKIGGGAPAIKTPEGWLHVYHAKGRDQVYSLFVVLLDLADPSIVLRRGKEPFMTPQAAYETEGFFGNVIFSNGLIEEEDGRILLYYGAADESSCLLETSIDELMASLDNT